MKKAEGGLRSNHIMGLDSNQDIEDGVPIDIVSTFETSGDTCGKLSKYGILQLSHLGVPDNVCLYISYFS